MWGLEFAGLCMGAFFYQLNSFIFTIYVGSYSGNLGSIIIVFFSSQRIRVSYFILCLGFSSYLNFWISYFVVPLCCPFPPFLVIFTYSNLRITDSVKILPHSLGLFKYYFFLFTSLGTSTIVTTDESVGKRALKPLEVWGMSFISITICITEYFTKKVQ